MRSMPASTTEVPNAVADGLCRARGIMVQTAHRANDMQRQGADETKNTVGRERYSCKQTRSKMRTQPRSILPQPSRGKSANEGVPPACAHLCRSWLGGAEPTASTMDQSNGSSDSAMQPEAATAAAAATSDDGWATWRQARKLQLQALKADELRELVLLEEERWLREQNPLPPAQAAAAAASLAPTFAPSSVTPATPAALPRRARNKHAHSPTALSGEEPPAKQSKRDRKKDEKAAAKAAAVAGARAPSKSPMVASEATDEAASSNVSVDAPPAASSKRKAEFDWSGVPRRQIALKLMYIGTNYAGFAIQPQLEHEKTVEGELVRALLLTKLAPERDAARLTRCGRTDKGVHASGQVIAVQVRSRLTNTAQLGMLPKDYKWRDALAEAYGKKKEYMDELQPAAGDTSLYDKQGYLAPAAVRDSMCARCGLPGVGFATDADCSTHEQELDYVRMLNGVLPPTIRIISWQPVSPDFNARFSCAARTYRYFFHADQLDLGRMQRAASQLIGSHDFRNFCKIDPSMSTHFIRFLTNIEIRACYDVPEDCVQIAAPWPCQEKEWFEDTRNSSGGIEAAAATAAASPSPSRALHPDTFCELLIHGNAFLYHQVRCMAAVLFLVGRGVESEDCVQRMLDVTRTPNKPNYDMAPEMPLVLYDTCFPSLPVTPGFDFQTRPASEPTDHSSFVGRAAKQQADMEATGAVRAESAATTGDPAAASSSSAAPAAAATSASCASASSSASTAAPALCLYPSAAACLRNEELVFAHFHKIWRELSMDAKVHELFVNQCARNLQSVRNECAKFDMDQLNQMQVNGPRVQANQRLRKPSQPVYVSPPVVRSFAPLLPATAGCRGHGLRVMPYVTHGSYTSIFHRPTEKSYEQKVAQLKGKKLSRHQSVKEMSDKFKKPPSNYKPMQTMQEEPSPAALTDAAPAVAASASPTNAADDPTSMEDQ